MEKLYVVFVKKICSIFSTILFYTLIFLLLIFTVAHTDMKQSGDVAHIFGFGFLSIQSDSTAWNQQDSSTTRDIVLVKMIEEPFANELKTGHVITYYDQTSNQFVTQRIVDKYEVEETLYYITQSDDSALSEQVISASEISGVYQSSILGLGQSLDFVQSPKGFTGLVIFPVLIILLIECVRLVKNLANFSKLKSEARVNKNYKQILKSLEKETNRIRHQVMTNWISEIDYEKIVRLRL